MFVFFNYVLAVFFFFITFYPLYFVVIASFSDAGAVTQGDVWITPVNFTLEGYKVLFRNKEVWLGYRNTIFYTIAGTIINLFCTVPAAYALSRKTLPGRKFINLYFILTMFLSGGLVPTYLLVRDLQLLNTPWIVIILGAVNVWNMLICKSFFENSIPEELYDAGKIDGCSNTGLFIHIAMPLSKALMAVMLLYFSVGHWNSYYNAMIYLQNDKLQPLQLVMRKMYNSSVAMAATLDVMSPEMMEAQSMKFAIIIAASLPVLCLYPFVQKHFVKGVMVGAVKG